MRPPLSTYQSVDTTRADAEFCRQFALKDSTSGVPSANDVDRVDGELGPCRAFPAWGATLTAHVLRILTARAQKEMIRPNAGWIIAMMTDKQSFRNWSTREFPRDARSVYITPIDADHSIAKACSECLPRPACVGPLDLVPEPIRKWDRTLCPLIHSIQIVPAWP